MVTANRAPATVTKIIPASVRPNQIIANGAHATDGIDCNPKIIEPMVSFTVWTLAMKIPNAMPPNAAIANPAANLQRLVPIPSQRLPSIAPYHKVCPTLYGEGKMLGGQILAEYNPCQTTIIAR